MVRYCEDCIYYDESKEKCTSRKKTTKDADSCKEYFSVSDEESKDLFNISED